MTMSRDDEIRNFLKDADWGRASLAPLPGDASTRRYARVSMDGRKAMLMDQPQNADPPKGYNLVARLAGADTERFAGAARYLRDRGLTAPDVFHADHARGFVLLEDLGDDLYADVMSRGDAEAPLYEAAIDALVSLHREGAPPVLAPGKPLFAYDEAAMLAEVDLLAEWFLKLVNGKETPPELREEHQTLWHAVLAHLPATRPVFVHRDYHAQNLMWLGDRDGVERVGMIDFQDALAGHPAYDLISLLEDARREVSPAMSDFMTALYVSRARAEGICPDEHEFRAAAAILAAQRNAKIIGIFARLWLRDKKPRYLGYLPRVWGYMERDLSHPALAPLKAWYDRHVPRALRGVPKVEGAA